MPELTFDNAGLGNGDFELVVQIRNHKGEPTGKTRSIRSDEPSKIAEFFHRMTGKPKKRKGRKASRRDQLPSADEARKILTQINQE